MSYSRLNLGSVLLGLCLAFTLISCSSSSPEDEWAGEDSFFGEEDQAIVDGTGEDFSGDDFSDFEDFGDFDDFDSMEVADEDMDFSDFEDFDSGEDVLAQELSDQSLGDDDFFFEEPEDELADSFSDPLADDAFGADAFADTSMDAPMDVPVAPLASVDEFVEHAPDNLVPLDEEFETSFDEPVVLADANAQAGLVPVKKIDSMPRYRGGSMLNAVYIARPGDTVDSISQRIYGEDRSMEIIEHNPWLSDGIKVGEKLYYNSPNRPSDNTAMLTYYEDVGTAAKTYITGGSENIRTLSTDLLGFDGAWKEVWATNFNVVSKDILPSGTELKYWTEAAPAAPAATVPLAKNETPSLLPPGMDFEPEPLGGDLMAATDLPPPPAAPAPSSFDEFPEFAPSEFEDPIQAQAPVPVDELSLPPPPPAPSAGATSQSSSSSGGDMTTMLALGLGGVAVILLIVSYTKKRRPVSMEYTQV